MAVDNIYLYFLFTFPLICAHYVQTKCRVLPSRAMALTMGVFSTFFVQHKRQTKHSTEHRAQSLCAMSGGHFKNRRKNLLLRKIQTDAPVEFEEKVSPFTSTTSKDPLLIAKADLPKVEGQFHSSDRIVKVVQIQTGGGKVQPEKTEENNSQESEKDSDSDSSSTTSSSSISLDLEDQSIQNLNLTERKKRKATSPEPVSRIEEEKNRSPKKRKTYGFNIVKFK